MVALCAAGRGRTVRGVPWVEDHGNCCESTQESTASFGRGLSGCRWYVKCVCVGWLVGARSAARAVCGGFWEPSVACILLQRTGVRVSLSVSLEIKWVMGEGLERQKQCDRVVWVNACGAVAGYMFPQGVGSRARVHYLVAEL